jgi:hypothetical protein
VQRHRGGEVAEAVGFPPLPALTQSVATKVGERTQYSLLACVPLRPHLLYIVRRDRAPLGRWTDSVEINTNILPLDLTFVLWT